MIKKGHAGEDYFPSFPKKKEKNIYLLVEFDD